MEKTIIKIRFNTECKDDINYWRALINGSEQQFSNIVINTKCTTTKDFLEDRNEYKWHITAISDNYEIKHGVLTIN